MIFIFVHFFSAHLKPGLWPLDRVIFTGSLPVEQNKEDRELEYAEHERHGTLDAVVTVKTVTWRTHVANAIWYTIAVVAAAAAVALTAVFIWWLVA